MTSHMLSWHDIHNNNMSIDIMAWHHIGMSSHIAVIIYIYILISSHRWGIKWHRCYFRIALFNLRGSQYPLQWFKTYRQRWLTFFLVFHFQKDIGTSYWLYWLWAVFLILFITGYHICNDTASNIAIADNSNSIISLCRVVWPTWHKVHLCI